MFCALSYICTFLLLSLCDTSACGLLVPKGIYNVFIFEIYRSLKMQFNKTKVNLSQALVTLADFGYPVYLLPKTFK